MITTPLTLTTYSKLNQMCRGGFSASVLSKVQACVCMCVLPLACCASEPFAQQQTPPLGSIISLNAAMLDQSNTVRHTHLLQGVHGLGEDGLPVGPHKHDENDMVRQQVHNCK